MKEEGFTKDDFHFIKRKGRIITQHRTSKDEFSYYLKKEIELNPQTSEFIDRLSYELRIDQEAKTFVADWEEVLASFQSWLQNLS